MKTKLILFMNTKVGCVPPRALFFRRNVPNGAHGVRGPAKIKRATLLILLAILNLQFSTVFAQSTTFTYQGRLTENGALANGSNDLTFTLYDSLSGGAIVGTSNVVNDLTVSNGLFNVVLDFGGAFDGSARWLQIAARPGVSVGAYTVLLPRQQITATPYAVRALSAGTAVTATTASGVAAGAVTSAGLAPGSVGGAAIADGSITSADLNGSLLNKTFWRLGGNDGTTNFLGTTDDRPLELRVHGARAMRLEPTLIDLFHSNIVNIIGGSSGNFVGAGVYGATIGGGGADNYNDFPGATTNKATAHFSTVAGGLGNTAGGDYDTVGGGVQNLSSGFQATVSGGGGNSSTGVGATVGGGLGNSSRFNYATVGGGLENLNNGFYATIGGGRENLSVGTYATVPGGFMNFAIGKSSFAAGQRANAGHDGAFVWADSQATPFFSTASNQFAVRASGGVKLSDDTSLHWGGSKLWADQGGSIELGDSTRSFAIPYIDFHYGVSGDEDFNVRLINDANDQLTLEGGFRVTGTVTASSFSGDGAGLTSLPAHVALRGGGNAFTGNQTIAGSVVVDQANQNAGTVSDASLTFGTASGEGIASRRTGPGGGNQYGLDFYSASQNRMTILNNGNVGIGTLNPQAPFHANGSARIDAKPFNFGEGLILNLPTDMQGFGYGGIHFHNAPRGSALGASTIRWGLFYNYTPEGGTSGGGLAFVRNNTSTRLYVSGADGFIGIGKTTPASELDVNGVVTASSDVAEPFEARGATAGYAMQDRLLFGASGRWSISAAGGALGFYRAGTGLMTVDLLGNACATSFRMCSDRNLKQDFAAVDAREVLEKVAQLPIQSWTFKNDPNTKHLGPMAQDFYTAFGVGSDDKHITTVDESGVALAAIQGLNQKLTAELQRKENEMSALRLQNSMFEKRLAELEQSILKHGQAAQ